MERPTGLLRSTTRPARPHPGLRAVLAFVCCLVLLAGCGREYPGRALPVTDQSPTTPATVTGPGTSLVPPTSAPSPPPSATSTPVPSATWWKPSRGLSWQWQLNGTIDTSVDARVYDVDLFTTPASVVDTLHRQGRKVICYMNAGAWEEFRPDAQDFPGAIKGRSNNWPGELWVDVRRLDVLTPIMAKRMDLCRAKGFDGIEVDEVDGYRAESGFPLSGADQLRFNRMLARLAHERGLAIGLKNDLDQVASLVNEFDFAVNEQCHEYQECHRLKPFIDAGKPVFHAEYNLEPGDFCPTARALGLSSILKEVDLHASPRQTC